MAKIQDTIKTSSKISFETVYGRPHGDTGALGEDRRSKASLHQPWVTLHYTTTVSQFLTNLIYLKSDVMAFIRVTICFRVFFST